MQEPTVDAELKVLLIEDNPADARLVQALSADAGDLAVTWVATLEAGLAQLRRSSVDAVLLDLLLPDGRGSDVIARVRAAAPGAAIVVASGQPASDHLLARAVIRKGADDLLPKAALSSELLARSLAMAVERARLKAVTERRVAAFAKALAEAGIGHWSWSAGSRMVDIAGRCPGLDPNDGARRHTTRQSAHQLLRRLPRWVRRIVHAARREIGAGTDRLAVVVVDAERPRGGPAGELILDVAVARDRRGRIARIDGIVREASGSADIERLEGEMITHLGHELRTPLTTIRGALGLLANADESRLTPSSRTLVDNALANANRIGQVIGEVLLQGSEAPDCCHFQPRRVPLGRFLYDAVAARLPTLTAAGKSLVLAPGAHALDDLVDAGRLRRALDCLCRSLLADGVGAARDRSGPTRFALDVATHDAHLWLRAAPAMAGAGCGGGARSRGGGAARLAVALAA